MRILALLVALVSAPVFAPQAQEIEAPEGALITSAQVSGIALAHLSPGLREEIEKLAGTPLDRARLRELAARIEGERPHHVAAVRAVQVPLDPTGAGGEVRVVFVVARLRDQDREANVNARYVIEHADVKGVPDEEVGGALRDELQSLVGKRLDSAEAEQLEHRLRQALPRYDVSRRIVRGSEPGKIRLVYEARRSESSRWLRFQPRRSDVVYHSEQGWGSYFHLPIATRDFLLTPIVAIDNGDDLIEEYSGFGLRFETRKLGTERLGASLEWSTFDPTWRSATLTALGRDPGMPSPYEQRSTVMPLAAFALTPELSVRAGVGITELALAAGAGARMANVAVASLEYDQRWKDRAGGTHDADAAFSVRAGSRALESDLVYNRYVAQGWYRFGLGRHRVLVGGMAGGITGDAPLFERFVLGDSTTLRGWDKYDIAPAGGERMFHASVEYRYLGVALFLDVGSVWEEGSDKRVRTAAGLGFHPGPVFFTVGFPLNTENLSAVFTMGIRVPGIGIRK